MSTTATLTIQRPPLPAAVVAQHRPPATPGLPASTKRRVAIAGFLLLANLVQMISNGATIAGGFEIGRDLGVGDIRLSNWVAASYP
jgi:hypothetical protein